MAFHLSDKMRNRLDRIFRPARAPIIPVQVSRDGDRVTLSDGTRSLRILAEARARKYKRGIDTRLTDLAAQYGIPRYVDVRPNDTVVNIGANIGELVLYCAERGANVIAVEPDDFTFECLRYNLVGHDKVQFVKNAIWNKDETVVFNIDPADANGSISNAGQRTCNVDARKLDTLLSALPASDTIRLIVGDAEGSEPEVLEGAADTLRRTQFVSLDCGYERGGERTLETCARMLDAAGFEIVRQQKNQRCNLVGRNRALHALS